MGTPFIIINLKGTTMFRKSLLALSVMALSSWAIPSIAETVTLAAGAPGGGYDNLMKKISSELTNRGHTVVIKNLGGSEDILSCLDSGQCDYGPAQKDIYYLMNKQNAGLSSGVTPLDILYREAMTLACSEESGIDELEDISADNTIIIDKLGSGSALTWSNMVSIEKEFGNGSSWASAKTVFKPLDEAGADIALGNADCAFGVGKVPSTWAKNLEERGLTISYIYDKDLNDLIFNKQPLYNSYRIAKGAYNTKFDTYLITAVIFKSSKSKTPEVESLVKRLAGPLGKQMDTIK